MDKNIDDGGPAFPVPDTYLPNGQVQYGINGMSLRDYFAAKAMQAILSNTEFLSQLATKTKDGDTHTLTVAIGAYEAADAMITARNRK